MTKTIRATFRNGTFHPDEPCGLAEDTAVVLRVDLLDSSVIPPRVTDPVERARILSEVVERMRNNPIPEGAPRKFTRDELHERR